MSNAVYPLALKALMDGDVDLLNDTIKVCLLDDTAAYSAANQYLSSVSTGNRVGTDATIGATKTTTGGVFDSSADCTWTAVTGNQVTKLVIYKFVTDDAASPLLVWMDTFASGFPFTPNGGDFTLTWHTSGIFSI